MNGPVDLNLDTSLSPRNPPDHNTTNMCNVFHMLTRGLNDNSRSKTLAYDATDSGRQCLDNILWDLSRVFEGAFQRRDLNATLSVAKSWMDLADTLDTLLNSNSNFMLGTWLQQAHATAVGDSQIDLLDYNARNQITLGVRRRIHFRITHVKVGVDFKNVSRKRTLGYHDRCCVGVFTLEHDVESYTNFKCHCKS